MSLDRLAPAIFVVLWSTGWVVAKYAAPHADPLTFLALRYAAAVVVFLAICAAGRAAWPAGPKGIAHAMGSGVLLHGIYLGGVWWAIAHGVPAALSGLIAALQPLMTSFLAPFIVNERLSATQRLGIALGFAGLLVAIVPGLMALDGGAIAAAIEPLMINVVAMIAVTAGTIYQKRYLQVGDLRSIATLQYLGALVVTLPAAWLLEPMRIDWTLETAIALGWSVFGLSVGAIALLLYLIRRGQVSRAASLIYLVPPTVAVQTTLLFGERLTGPMILGTVIVVTGVFLTSRPARSA